MFINLVVGGREVSFLSTTWNGQTIVSLQGFTFLKHAKGCGYTFYCASWLVYSRVDTSVPNAASFIPNWADELTLSFAFISKRRHSYHNRFPPLSTGNRAWTIINIGANRRHDWQNAHLFRNGLNSDSLRESYLEHLMTFGGRTFNFRRQKLADDILPRVNRTCICFCCKFVLARFTALMMHGD